MTKAIVVEDAQLANAVAVARASSNENGYRDTALLLCFFGTGMKPAELSQLLVSDYLPLVVSRWLRQWCEPRLFSMAALVRCAG